METKETLKILAVETSGRTFSAALTETRGSGRGETSSVKAEIFFDVGPRHSETLAGACAFLLKEISWPVESLSACAVSTGPGSFTGLRVGISFARGIAQALDIPLIGVPTFEVLARGIERAEPGARKPFCIVIDSIGQEVCAGTFLPGSERPEHPYRTYTVPELCREVRRNHAGSRLCFAGDGFLRHESEIMRLLGDRARRLPDERSVPRAADLAEISAARISRIQIRAKSWKDVVPFYLRPPMAVERNLKGRPAAKTFRFSRN